MTSYNSRNYLQREQKTRKDQESFLANNARGGSHLTITCVKNQRLFYMCERERKGMTDELAQPLSTKPRNFRDEKQNGDLGKLNILSVVSGKVKNKNRNKTTVGCVCVQAQNGLKIIEFPIHKRERRKKIKKAMRDYRYRCIAEDPIEECVFYSQ